MQLITVVLSSVFLEDYTFTPYGYCTWNDDATLRQSYVMSTKVFCLEATSTFLILICHRCPNTSQINGKKRRRLGFDRDEELHRTALRPLMDKLRIWKYTYKIFFI